MSLSIHYELFKYPYLEIFNRNYIKNYTCLPGGESYYDEGLLHEYSDIFAWELFCEESEAYEYYSIHADVTRFINIKSMPSPSLHHSTIGSRVCPQAQITWSWAVNTAVFQISGYCFEYSLSLDIPAIWYCGNRFVLRLKYVNMIFKTAQYMSGKLT